MATTALSIAASNEDGGPKWGLERDFESPFRPPRSAFSADSNHRDPITEIDSPYLRRGRCLLVDPASSDPEGLPRASLLGNDAGTEMGISWKSRTWTGFGTLPTATRPLAGLGPWPFR